MREDIMAVEKRFQITETKHRDGKTYVIKGTLTELIKSYSYTLDTGRSYQNEKGNKKINCNPKSIKSLVSNLNNAVNNSAANGYAGKDYDFIELPKEVQQ